MYLLWHRDYSLTSLSWQGSTPVRQDILDLFHKHCPKARLDVVNRDRNGYELDELLLSSPQLHRLEMAIYFKRSSPPDGPGQTELQTLKQYLMRGNSVKVLHLRFIPKHGGLDDEVEGTLNFHWSAGDQFPALEEFTWRGLVAYDFSLAQCRAWTRCMDWSELRKLSLMQPSSMHFFEHMTGKLPGLVDLSLEKLSFDHHELEDEEHGISIMSAFLGSIKALEALRLGGSRLKKLILPVLTCHGKSLESLVLEIQDLTQDWPRETYMTILQQAPNLCYMNVRVVTSNFEGVVGHTAEWRSSKQVWTPQEKFDSLSNSSLILPTR
jgi:hypothetical protein